VKEVPMLESRQKTNVLPEAGTTQAIEHEITCRACGEANVFFYIVEELKTHSPVNIPCSECGLTMIVDNTNDSLDLVDYVKASLA